MKVEVISDILVIGSGLAGLLFAHNVLQNSNLTISIVTKRSIDEANTKYAQGGIAAVLTKNDSFSSHVNDTLSAGDGLCRQEVVKEFVSDAPKIIQDLLDLGINFNRDPDNSLNLGREGGHSARRIVHVNDMTGDEIQTKIVQAVKTNITAQIYEYHSAIDLVFINNKISGAYVLDIKKERVLNFTAKIVVLATGGAGKVFLYTSNPDIASGDGIAMAFRAGGTIANMEFIQFHPTIYHNPAIKSFLVSEALRGEGAILKTINGKHFMKDIHPLGELAPRDIIARAIDLELKKSGDDYVFLDISFKDPEFIKNRFPGVYSSLLKFGTNFTVEPIPVVPAAHYTIGGVQTKINGDTGVRGLLAIGEVASTGFHGANRLASNSLLEAAVMAVKASQYAIQQIMSNKIALHTFPPWETGSAVDSDESVIISHNWDELRRAMWNYVGIVRSNKRLLRAKQRIKVLKQEVLEYYWKFNVTSDIIELRNIVLVAELIIKSALARKESRGAHYSLDYPNKLDSIRDTLIQKLHGVHYSEEINTNSK